MILNLIYSSNPDHAAVITLHRNISQLLLDKECRVTTIFLTGVKRDINLPGSVQFLQIEPSILRKKGWINRIKYLSVVKHLLSVLNENQIEAVLCDGITLMSLMASAQKKYPINAIGVFHGIRPLRKKYIKPVINQLRLWHFIAVSASQKKQLEQANSFLQKGNFSVISNALDIQALQKDLLEKKAAREHLNLPLDKFIFGIVGRLSNVKNHFVVIETISKLVNQNKWPPNAQLAIIGDGELKLSIEKSIHSLKLQDQIILVGKVENAARYLQAFNCFIMPSKKEEAFGLSLLEACIAKLPIVSSNICTFRNIAGENAYYFQQDSSNELANIMEEILHTPTITLQEQGEKIFAHASKNYGLTEFREKYWQLFCKTLKLKNE